jgi:hypothetical protein
MNRRPNNKKEYDDRCSSDTYIQHQHTLSRTYASKLAQQRYVVGRLGAITSIACARVNVFTMYNFERQRTINRHNKARSHCKLITHLVLPSSVGSTSLVRERVRRGMHRFELQKM